MSDDFEAKKSAPPRRISRAIAASVFAHLVIFTFIAIPYRWHIQPNEQNLTVEILAPIVASSIHENEAPRRKQPVPPAQPMHQEAEFLSEFADAPRIPSPSAAASIGPTNPGESYKADLRAAIDQLKEYPAISRARHEMGRVGVGFTVQRDGTIVNIHLASVCAFERLNSAALHTVQALGKFRPFPEEMPMQSWDVVVPIDYVLE